MATTTLSADPTAVGVGSSVALSTTVQALGKTVAPTGTVTLLDGTTLLNATPVALTPNSFTSNTFQQTFGAPDPVFTPQPNLFGGSGLPQGELAGDLNGDGIPDILIYSIGSPFSTQSFTSNGKGGYTTGPVQTLSFPNACTSNSYVFGLPQLVDINGDGKMDFLCGSMAAYGNGDGTFAAATPVSFLSNGYYTAYAADLNADGKTDILAVPVLPYMPVSGLVQLAVTVFLNQGSGSFVASGTYPVAASISSLFGYVFAPPVVIDLNNDGKPDLIAQTLSVGPTQSDNPKRGVDVLLNNGDGTFGGFMPLSLTNAPNYTGGPNPYGMGAGDVDGDGNTDLILTETDTASNVAALIVRGNGDGTFQPQTNLILYNSPGERANTSPSPSVEDLNSDGKQDLIFSDGQVALGNGDGTFVLSAPLFLYQQSTFQAPWVFPVLQLPLPGATAPSLIYLLPSSVPAAASVFTPQYSSSGSVSVSTLAAGTHTITAHYSGDANYAANASAAVTVTVNQAASAIAATSSANPSFAGEQVTLTAKVNSNGPTPTGNFVFMNGTTTLATVTLSQGSASYATSSFTTAGTQTITMSYSGDANTLPSSATLSQVVNPAITLAPSSNASTTLTVKAGHVVTTPINVSGAGGFSGQVTLACSGLPANTSCSFSPATVAVSGTTPVSSQLSVNTGAGPSTAQAKPDSNGKFGGVAYSLGFAGLMLLWPIRRVSRIRMVLLCTIALVAAGVTGCGSGSGGASNSKAATGTYQITVLASSGPVQAQSAYTLVVQ